MRTLVCTTLAGAIALAVGTAHAVPVVKFYAVDVNPTATAPVSAFGPSQNDLVVGFSQGQGAFLVGPNQPLKILSTLRGSTSSRATAVNDAGEVAGVAFFSFGGAPHERGTITGPDGVGVTDIGSLAATGIFGTTSTLGINASGQVAGMTSVIGGALHAYISDAHGVTLHDLGSLAGPSGFSAAFAVNSSGQAAGQTAVPGSPAMHAFITGPNGAGMTDLGTLGGASSQALAINELGVVVGLSKLTSDSGALQHAFITGPGGVGMTDIGLLNGAATVARGVNLDGNVVGTATAANGSSRAFVTANGGAAIQDLTALTHNPPTVMKSASGINDAGHILATGANGHAYLLCPTKNCK
jgi:probable HAF family extracellular repeat protein